MAIFTRNQRRWESKPISEEQAKSYARELGLRDIDPVVAHDGYLINLAAKDDTTLARSKKALLDELHRAEVLGLAAVVAHPGSHVGRGVAAGIQHFVKNLDRCLEQSGGDDGVTIAIENTAGQGTNLGSELGEIRDIIAASKYPKRLAVCIDTCHTFAAGYDISSEDAYEETIELIDERLGIDRVVVWHLNDSRFPLGSRRDRHADIGEGHLGLEPFRLIVNDPRWAGLAGILETPGGPDNWGKQLETLRAMRI